jgi:hypothetical protein
MNPIRYFWREWERLYLKWALSEICPLHPDVPGIVHRLRELEAK